MKTEEFMEKALALLENEEAAELCTELAQVEAAAITPEISNTKLKETAQGVADLSEEQFPEILKGKKTALKDLLFTFLESAKDITPAPIVYITQTPILHRRRYEPGEVFDITGLSEKQVARLIKSEAIKLKAGE
jgi:hypothetical protein